MQKRIISLLLVCVFFTSIFILPIGATNVSGEGAVGTTTKEVTIYVPPKSSAIVPAGWVGSGSVIQYPVGTLTSGNWIYVTITANSSGIPVIMQLYCASGAAYSQRTITSGTIGWQAKKSAYHYLLITNDNNYGTNVSFYLTY